MMNYSNELQATMISLNSDRKLASEIQREMMIQDLECELEILMFSLSGVRCECVELTPDDVIQAVSLALDVDKEAMRSKTRKREVVEARAIAMRMIIDHVPGISLKKIGELFGGRDHSTVIYNRETFDDLEETNVRFLAKINKVKEGLLRYEN